MLQPLQVRNEGLMDERRRDEGRGTRDEEREENQK